MFANEGIKRTNSTSACVNLFVSHAVIGLPKVSLLFDFICNYLVYSIIIITINRRNKYYRKLNEARRVMMMEKMINQNDHHQELNQCQQYPRFRKILPVGWGDGAKEIEAQGKK